MEYKIAIALHKDESEQNKIFLERIKRMVYTKESPSLYYFYDLIKVKEKDYYKTLILAEKLAKELQLKRIVEADDFDVKRPVGSVSLFVVQLNIPAREYGLRQTFEIFKRGLLEEYPFKLNELFYKVNEALGLQNDKLYTFFNTADQTLEYIAISNLENAKELKEKAMKVVRENDKELLKEEGIYRFLEVKPTGKIISTISENIARKPERKYHIIEDHINKPENC